MDIGDRIVEELIENSSLAQTTLSRLRTSGMEEQRARALVAALELHFHGILDNAGAASFLRELGLDEVLVSTFRELLQMTESE